MEPIKHFGWALGKLKAGKRVCRTGWNGKGMFITKMPGYEEAIPADHATCEAFGLKDGDDVRVKVRPYLAMMDAKGYIVPGWLASQTDLLAEDWEIVE
jgi:hypothetical protein